VKGGLEASPINVLNGDNDIFCNITVKKQFIVRIERMWLCPVFNI
jgi:hypothetical protein